MTAAPKKSAAADAPDLEALAAEIEALPLKARAARLPEIIRAIAKAVAK